MCPPVTVLVYLLYTAVPVLVAFAYQRCEAHNPQPAKLLLLAASLELVVSAAVLQARRWQRQLVSSRNPTSRNGAAARAWSLSAVQGIFPGFCCFLSSNLAFYALQRLPLHAYALLYSLRVVATAALVSLLLQQKPSRQSRWSLLLLLAAVCIGLVATMGTSGHPMAAAAAAAGSLASTSPPAAAPAQPWQQQQQPGVQPEPAAAPLLPGLAAMAAVALLSSAASVHTEWLQSRAQRHAAAEPMQLLHSASLACWTGSTAAALNGVLCMIPTLSLAGPAAAAVGVPPPPAAAAAAAGVGGGATSTTAPGFWSDLGPVHWALVCILAATGVSGGVAGRGCQGSLHTACTISLAVLLAVSASPMLLPQHHQQQQQPSLLFYVACCLAAAALMQLLRQQQQQQHSPDVAAVGPQAAKQQHPVLMLMLLQQQGAGTPPAGRRAAGTSSSLYTHDSMLLNGMQWLLGASKTISSSSSSNGGITSSSSSSSTGARSSSSSSTPGLKGVHSSLLGARSSTPLGWPAAGLAAGAGWSGWSAELICWLLGVLDGLVVAAVVLSVLLLLSAAVPTASSVGGSSGYLQRGRLTLPTSAAAMAVAAVAAHQNTTDVPMPPELVSMPCSNGGWLQRERFCPAVNCSLAPDCTVSNPGCCAHLNLRMLVYLDHLLSSMGLSQHYVIVYGTLLGAVRNKTILAHTNDVDVALSAAAITLLEQRPTQLELWRHGYIFWCSDNVWRLCAHQHHPSPAFRGLMLPGQQHTLQGGPYVDAYLMWPTQPAAAAAVEAAVASLRAAAAAQEAASAASTRANWHQQAQEQGHAQEQQQEQEQQQKQEPGHTQKQQGVPSQAGLPLLLPAGPPTFGLWAARRRHEWQLCFSTVPVKLSGRRRVWLEGLRVVVPDNAEHLLAGTYGPRWRTPNLRPYAPSYDEDECVEAVLRLNSTLFPERGRH